MTPVSGEISAWLQRNAGSSAQASSPLSQRSVSTPAARARRSIFSSPARSASLAATISLPQRRWSTPWLRQKSTSFRRPSTHSRAFSDPGS